MCWHNILVAALSPSTSSSSYPPPPPPPPAPVPPRFPQLSYAGLANQNSPVLTFHCSTIALLLLPLLHTTAAAWQSLKKSSSTRGLTNMKKLGEMGFCKTFIKHWYMEPYNLESVCVRHICQILFGLADEASIAMGQCRTTDLTNTDAGAVCVNATRAKWS